MKAEMSNSNNDQMRLPDFYSMCLTRFQFNHCKETNLTTF